MISEDEEREEHADVLGMDSLNAGREKGIAAGSSETGAAAVVVVETGTGKMGGSARSKRLGLVVSDSDSDSLFVVAVAVPRAGLLFGLSGRHEYGYGHGYRGVHDGDGEIETGADGALVAFAATGRGAMGRKPVNGLEYLL